MRNNKRLCIIWVLWVFVFAIISCEKVEETNIIPIEKIENAKIINHMVCTDLHMTQNLLFLPNYFEPEYDDNQYEKSIDNWTVFNYSDAENGLLETLNKIESSEKLYCPEDEVFIKEALGVLYVDLANYQKAYDYLLESYVILKDNYEDAGEIQEDKKIYFLGVGLALCHYYYTVGDYDSCFIEIDRLREINESLTDNNLKNIKLFIDYKANEIEACIKLDRGEYAESYNTFCKNLKILDECYEIDPTSYYILKIDLCSHLGDLYSENLAYDNNIEYAHNFYDIALENCDYFEGDFKERKRSEILIKKGKMMFNVVGERELAWDAINEAKAIQEELISQGKKDPGIINVYRTLAEVYGFVERDQGKAEVYYKKTLEIIEEFYGENHPETALVYESMGRYYGNVLRDDEKAIEYYLKSEEIYRNLLLENNIKIADIYLYLAGAYASIDDKETSDEYLDKAYSMYGELGIKILQTDGTWK